MLTKFKELLLTEEYFRKYNQLSAREIIILTIRKWNNYEYISTDKKPKWIICGKFWKTTENNDNVIESRFEPFPSTHARLDHWWEY